LFVSLSLVFPGFLRVDDNRLTGSIPDGIYSNTIMNTFYANNNLLTGSIFPLIQQMSALENFRIGANYIGGVLPDEVFTLPRIEEFNLTTANFTGTLSERFTLLNQTLTHLVLENNDFFGPLPSAFDVLAPNLKQLILHGNRLTGEILQGGALCNNRGDSFFDINNLTSDCEGPNIEVVCECCTYCPSDKVGP
jgi:uncharacterized protein YjbI with pentapeptide repeats